MVSPRKEINGLLEALDQTDETPKHNQTDETPNHAPKNSEGDKALGPNLVVDTVELTPQKFVRIKGHKVLTDGENLVKRLPIDVSPQDRPYLDLGHSPLVIKKFVHCHIGGFDLEVNLASMLDAKNENPN